MHAADSPFNGGSAAHIRSIPKPAACAAAARASRHVEITQREDQAPRALVGPLARMRRRSALHALLLGDGLTRGQTLRGFAVEGLRDTRRATPIAECKQFDLEVFLASRDAQAITDTQGARRFAARAIDLDAPPIGALFGQGARLEEARSPQPDIQTHARRDRGSRCFARHLIHASEPADKGKSRFIDRVDRPMASKARVRMQGILATSPCCRVPEPPRIVGAAARKIPYNAPRL